MTRGNPWDFNKDKNSNVYISKPKLASITKIAISATFAKSIIAQISLGH